MGLCRPSWRGGTGFRHRSFMIGGIATRLGCLLAGPNFLRLSWWLILQRTLWIRHHLQAPKAQQALDETGCLPQRHAKQHLHGKACLDGGIAVALLAATPACRRGRPVHLGVEPDRQRATALERFIVGWPVPGLVGQGGRSAHAPQLPRWIHEMNPSWDLCNRAPYRSKPYVSVTGENDRFCPHQNLCRHTLRMASPSMASVLLELTLEHRRDAY